MDKIREVVKELLLFIFIGFVIDSFYFSVVLSDYVGMKVIIISLLLSGAIGIVIGTISKFIFLFILSRTINIRMAMISEGIVVAILTAGVSYFFNGRDIINLIIIPILGAGFAVIITYIYYSIFINKKLKELQKKLK